MASVPAPRPPSRATLILQAISRAYFARERARLGIGAEQRADQEAAGQDMLRKAQMARLIQQMGFEPEDRASELAHRDAQTKLYGAQADAAAALAGQRETPKPGTPHYTTDENGNVTAVVPQPDGSFKAVKVGNFGRPTRPPAPSIAILPSEDGYVRVDRRGSGPATPVEAPGGGQLPLPPTTAQRNVAAGATAPQQAVAQAQKRAIPVLQDLGSRITALNKDREGGVVDRVGGVLRRGAGAVGADSATDLYTTGVRGFVPLFARSVGHVGVLTELDVKRTEDLFPRIGDAANVTAEKLARLQRIMTGQEPMPFQFEHPEYDDAGITQPGAGGAPPAPTGVSPNVQRILDLLKARNAGQ